MSNINGCQAASHVWCWVDEHRHPMYVGWGTVDRDGRMPWEQLWEQRERLQGELADKLASRAISPALDWRFVPLSPLTASAAAALAKLIRRQLAAEGVELLRDRDYRGSAPPRPAMGCRSIRALARQLGVSRRQASKLAGWDYDGRSGRRGSDYDGRP